MRFRFSTSIESLTKRAVFHFEVQEAGGSPRFESDKVITDYEGKTNDEIFKKIASLYETQENHSITLTRL